MTAPHRQGMRRAIVILPGAFTSGNLFFGIWSVIEASRGNFLRASWFIVVAGVLDLLDGRIARASRTGTAFGAELDSLVDVISFGVAPGLLLYYHTFKGGEWSWLIAFFYVLAVALRLARFNVEQAGHAKSQFFGLPSPAAGMTLATWYPFSQTAFFHEYLAGFWPWNTAIALLVVMVSLLMVSHVPYPVVPGFTVRNWRGVLSIAWALLVVVAAIYFPAYFFFPFGVGVIAFGLLRAAATGFLERLPERDPLVDSEIENGSRPTDDLVSPKPLLPFRLKRRRRGAGGTGTGGR